MNIKINALIVDDSGVMRKMVMKGLTESKLSEFNFIEAGDGMDALEKMKANDIDIGFVDWNMPNMTGIEFVTQVRKLEKADGKDPTPMIMVTSEKTIGKMQVALDEAGADHFISKPFTVEELVYKLKKHVERAQQMHMQKARQRMQSAQAQPASGGGWLGKLFS